MSRYIDAEALLKDLEEELEIDSPMLNEVENKWVDKGIRIAIKDVKHFPTADVVEVRHGHWEYLGFDAVCSECGYINEADTVTRCRSDPPYCPKCGAKMDGAKCESSGREKSR